MAYKSVNGKLVKIEKNRNRTRQNEVAHMKANKLANEVMRRSLERFDIDRMGTRERFEAMHKLAETNERKGKKGGDCNVTQCQKPGASSYNPAMRAYYCRSCAIKIRDSSLRHGDTPFILAEHIQRDGTFKYEGEV